MVRPERLRAVGRRYSPGEGLLPRMRTRERDMADRVPVLGEDDVVEAPREQGDAGHDLVSALDGERPAWQKVPLHIDHK